MEPLLVFQSKYLACTSIRARPLTAGRAPGYLREYELNQKPGGYNLQATGNQVAALVTFFGEEPPTTEDGSIRFAFNRIPGIPEAHWEENRLIDANGSTAIATIMTKLIDESIDLTGGQPFVRVIRNGIDAEADLEYARTFIVRDYPATLRQRNKPV